MTSVAETAQVYRTVLANGSLRRVLAAYLIFSAQEYGIWLAITLYAYDRGGATTAGLVAVAQLIPAAVVAPLASVVGDRMRRDHALALGYAVEAAAALACGIAVAFGPPPVVYATAVLSACSVTLTRPVHNAILPDLASDAAELTAANSVSSTAEGVGIMLGPLLAAFLIAVSGTAAVLFTFSALAALSAVITVHLRLRGVAAAPAEDDDGGLLGAALDGVRALRDDRPAGVLTMFGGVQFLLLGMLDIFYAVLVIDVLHIDQEAAGVLAAGAGIGGIVGAAITAILVGRDRLASPIQVAVGVAAGATAGLALVSAFGLALLLIVVAGAARSFFDVAARTLLQRSVRADVLSRVFGLQEAMLMIGLAVGSAVAPIFVSAFGFRGAFIAAGTLVLVSGVVAWPAMRLLDRRAVLPDPERFDLLRRLDLFAPLPQPAMEQLAARAFAISLRSGEVLIRQGDEGDRFYVITAGEVTIEKDGAEVARGAPGMYVGEIALLRDVPRTATVRAVGDVDVLALERDDFLDAVTGSRRSVRAADARMDRRIAELDER
jgi:MFS family permease